MSKNSNKTNDSKSSKRLAVYTIVPNTNGDGKDFWQRVGSAFVNRDGSINVVLNALPVNGRLHVRERRQEDRAA